MRKTIEEIETNWPIVGSCNSLVNLIVVTKIDEYMYHYNEERIQEKLGCHNSKRIWSYGSLKGVL
jgi:hypothetical protein